MLNSFFFQNNHTQFYAFRFYIPQNKLIDFSPFKLPWIKTSFQGIPIQILGSSIQNT